MSDKQPRLPGPDHPITITPSAQRIRVIWQGHVVADTTRALDLKEATYPVARYIPRADVDMAFLERTSHSTHCPYKGEASYYSLTSGAERADNAIWSYEEPFPAMSEIAGHVAFYPNKVTIEVS
jgi:uncharacterized protein (DUF427 family)